MNTSDTPRTDKLVEDWDYSPIPKILEAHARTLERELNAAQKIIRQQQLMDEDMLALKERINRLQDAGDAMASLLDGIGEADTWREAKEEKP
jgi:hypothetical protein